METNISFKLLKLFISGPALSQRKHSVTLIFTFVKQRNIYCQPNIFKSPNIFCPLTDVIFLLPSGGCWDRSMIKIAPKTCQSPQQRESEYARVDMCWLVLDVRSYLSGDSSNIIHHVPWDPPLLPLNKISSRPVFQMRCLVLIDSRKSLYNNNIIAYFLPLTRHRKLPVWPRNVENSLTASAEFTGRKWSSLWSWWWSCLLYKPRLINNSTAQIRADLRLGLC